MRTTTHHQRGHKGTGKAFGSKHNDRNYDTSQADNIDESKSINNHYWNYYDKDKKQTMTFEEVELKFYNEFFGAQLEATNQRYIENRHPERVKTMEQWKAPKRNAPEESIRQVGDKEQHIEPELLWKIEQRYAKWQNEWNREHGDIFTVLTRALHTDEATPHIQERKVWYYKDKKTGLLKIGQEKALEQAGVELPFPDKKLSRTNNRKITFDKICRDKWIDICEEFGLEIEREPVPDAKHNQTKEEYIWNKLKEAVKTTESQNELISQKQEELTRLNEKIALKRQSGALHEAIEYHYERYWYAKQDLEVLENKPTLEQINEINDYWKVVEPFSRTDGSTTYQSKFNDLLEALKRILQEIISLFSKLLGRDFEEQLEAIRDELDEKSVIDMDF